MKKQAYIVISVMMLVIVAGLSTSEGPNGKPRLVANIPFAFSVGERTSAGRRIYRALHEPESSAKGTAGAPQGWARKCFDSNQ